MGKADLILTGGKIALDVTGTRFVQALACRDGKILALGSSSEIAALAGPGTRRIALKGALVLPGFIDSHIHLQSGALETFGAADLTDDVTPEALVARLAVHAAHSQNRWVMGASYASGLLGPHNLTARLLDQAVPDWPCFILSSDAHNACVNTQAMAEIGLTAAVSDPENGRFVRDGAGQPTGLLEEEAVTWAMERLPRPDLEARCAATLAAAAEANRLGITGILDPSVGVDHVATYHALASRGALPLRVSAAVKVHASETPEGALARIRDLQRFSVGHDFSVQSAKFFLDGVFENRTAALIAPYADAQGGNAPMMFTQAQIDAFFAAFSAENLQIHVHAIGDLAVRAALDGFGAASRAGPIGHLDHQIAHIEVIDPADIPRFARLGVVANIQPLWARDEDAVSAIAAPMLGPNRSRFIYPFGSLHRAGADLVLSSDWPVSTQNPFRIIETALTRQAPNGADQRPSFLPNERLDLATCLLGTTEYASRVCGTNGLSGALRAGASCDLIVLDRDIFACNPCDIGATTLRMTLFKGTSVWEM